MEFSLNEGRIISQPFGFLDQPFPVALVLGRFFRGIVDEEVRLDRNESVGSLAVRLLLNPDTTTLCRQSITAHIATDIASLP